MNYAITLLTTLRELRVIRYYITEMKQKELRKKLNNYTNIMLSCQGLFNLLVIRVLDAC
jgi:hypothetical protein